MAVAFASSSKIRGSSGSSVPLLRLSDPRQVESRQAREERACLSRSSHVPKHHPGEDKQGFLLLPVPVPSPLSTFPIALPWTKGESVAVPSESNGRTSSSSRSRRGAGGGHEGGGGGGGAGDGGRAGGGGGREQRQEQRRCSWGSTRAGASRGGKR